MNYWTVLSLNDVLRIPNTHTHTQINEQTSFYPNVEEGANGLVVTGF